VSTQTDLASLNSSLAIAAAAAATAEKQVAAGTPSSWASIATMFAIANAQNSAAALAADVNPPPLSTLVGLWNNGTPAAELGVTPQLISDYADGANSTTYGYDSQRTQQQAGKLLMLGVGALTAAEATAIAETLIANGQPSALIRPMWEMNQHGWFPVWNQATMTAAEYIAEWKTIVNAMRSVAGQSFKFVWNPTADINGQNNAAGRTDTDTFAGTAYVDYVAVDCYDNNGSVAESVTCITEFVAFAKSEGLEWGLCEWGLFNNADDPAFVEAIQGLCDDGTCAFQALFSEVGLTSGNGTDITKAPNSLAAYRSWLG
jgi:hypothetical protein